MMVKPKPAYDAECFELAQYFLRDEPKWMQEECSELAMAIQNAVEDWFEMAKQGHEDDDQ